MKKLFSKYIVFILAFTTFVQIGCNDLLDLKPINELSDADFWKTPDQFKLAANEFYTYLRSFSDITADGPHYDHRADFIYSREGANVFSGGANTIPLTDVNWNRGYTRSRTINYFLEKAAAYPKPVDIKVFVAEAKFYRAYVYFDLLQQFGGVPIVNKVLTPESPELTAGRNTRDEVIDFIIADLEAAIADLPLESAIGAADKGRVSKGAAQGFLGRVALYEGTWQKFRSNATRANALLDKAISNSNAVITSAEYQLFAPAALGDSAQKYMFILENQQSNPANIVKSANKEYILANRYDFASRQIRANLTHQMGGNVHWITKAFADLYLSQDGLPISKSPLFKGYAGTTTEFQNRDNRMRYTIRMDSAYYWDNENPGSRVTWKSDAADIANAAARPFNAAISSGYSPQKWGTERRLTDQEEAYDYPVIRYAEVLLNYAEAVFEKNGTITDADLDKSLNLVRNRVNKTMPKLSNALVTTNGLNMRDEIRRERNIELFFEGFRIDDLKRWKTAEIELPKDVQGITWTGTRWETRWRAIKAQVFNGVYRLQTGRKWGDKNYLLPIPSQQIELNPKLEQNPGW